MQKPKRILVFSRGPVGVNMSAPGIRALGIARVLAREVPGARVTLAVPNPTDLPDADGLFDVVPYSRWGGMGLFRDHDLIISNNLPPRGAAFFPGRLFVADLFAQYVAEWMEVGKDHYRGAKRRFWTDMSRRYINYQLTHADFVTCANERQRDSYIGMMCALGLIDGQGAQRDPSLRRLVAVVPHGIRWDLPAQTRRVLRGVYAGIGEQDTILLWNGGIIPWYDPVTFIRAHAKLAAVRQDIKAVFLGSIYPGLGPGLGGGPRFREAFDLSRQLGLYNRHVFFEPGWIPYDDMKNYLLEADVGVCTYWDNLETRYSFRTRFMDLFWAEVPVLCTRGDVLAELVEREELGLVVPQGDVDAVAGAILRLADDTTFRERCKENIRRLKPRLSWEEACAPLVDFCTRGESIARGKGARTAPLLTRAGEYLLWRGAYMTARR